MNNNETASGVEHNSSTPSPLHSPTPKTPLASETEPFCKVVAPFGKDWEQLAHRFCVRVREFTRSEPEQITPDQVADEDFQRYHLILFGSILNNSAILKLYARQQCFTDGGYPGQGGVEIRTVVNPLGTGKNVLLIGGTDFPQIHEATIGLNRSFAEVTYEKDGILWLHRLNFCVSQRNCYWKPTETDAARMLKDVLAERDEWLHRAADFALYHYQSDLPVWARLFQQTVESFIDKPSTTKGVWRFVVGWSAVYFSPYFSDEFREVVDDLLLNIGNEIAAHWEEPPPSLPSPRAGREGRTRAQTSNALALHRIGQHFRRVRGENPFESFENRIAQVFDLPETPGERDWFVIDQWLGYQLERERYDLLETGVLSRFQREIVALTDNLKEPFDPYAQNVLLKATAFEDDGRHLWIRRWLRGDGAEIEYPENAPVPGWNWYTGAYAPDLVPILPADIPRMEVIFSNADEMSVAAVALRRDFDAANEYLLLEGRAGREMPPGAVRRTTWSGQAWLKGGAWTRSNRPATLLDKADLPGLGYVSLRMTRPDAFWTRHLFWKHGVYLFFLDEWETRDVSNREPRAVWFLDPPESGKINSQVLPILRSEGGESFDLSASNAEWMDCWHPTDARETRGTLLILRDSANLTPQREAVGIYELGKARVAIGSVTFGAMAVESRACFLEPGIGWFIGFESLSVGGETLLFATAPVHLQLQMESGEGRLVAQTDTELRWQGSQGEQSVSLHPGEYKMSFLGFDWSRLAQ